MKRTLAGLLAIACCAGSYAFALYTFEDKGTWPDTWPKELEHLRQQSRTYVGPRVLHRHYQIPFTKREEFEAAWPHLLKVKSKRAQLILVKAPYTRLGHIEAGVFIHGPPRDAEGQPKPAEPVAKTSKPSDREITYIELIVDGTIVDLNRIRLPADTPIDDQRFDPSQPVVK